MYETNTEPTMSPQPIQLSGAACPDRVFKVGEVIPVSESEYYRWIMYRQLAQMILILNGTNDPPHMRQCLYEWRRTTMMLLEG